MLVHQTFLKCSLTASNFWGSWGWMGHPPHDSPPPPGWSRTFCTPFFIRNIISTCFSPSQKNKARAQIYFLFCIHRKQDPIKREQKSERSQMLQREHKHRLAPGLLLTTDSLRHQHARSWTHSGRGTQSTDGTEEMRMARKCHHKWNFYTQYWCSL